MSEQHLKILFLSNNPEVSRPLFDQLRALGEDVLWCEEKLQADVLATQDINFIISYNYMNILRTDVLALFPGRALNLHIAYLPWNRGSDPNIWSYLDGTPSGVTIHLMNEGLDTGDILLQRFVPMDTTRETLRTSYHRLHQEIQALLLDNWAGIRAGKILPVRQEGTGSKHYKRDLDPFRDAIDYDLPIDRFVAALPLARHARKASMLDKHAAFTSERLTFRGIRAEDAAGIVEWRTQPEVYRYFLNPHPLTLEEHKAWYQERYLDDETRVNFMVLLRDGTPIGTVALSDISYGEAEISYLIGDVSQQRKGYAKEAIRAMMDFGAQAGITRFVAVVHPENVASIRSVETLGFRREGMEESGFLREVYP